MNQKANNMLQFNSPKEFKNAEGQLMATVEYLEEFDLIYTAYETNTSIEAYKTAKMYQLELTDQHKTSMHLEDASLYRGNAYDSREWLVQEFRPAAKAVGLKYWAAVTSNNVLLRFTINLILTLRKREADDYALKLFDTEGQALEWLQSQSLALAFISPSHYFNSTLTVKNGSRFQGRS